ncbi:MAG: hypothetical protein H6R10_1891 [Rhodocyclaceae bacterium]|nr:hypothetical protein [Rhodocyclaceae bacterium]
MNASVRIFQPRIVLHGSGIALVSDIQGQIHAEERYGLFAGDTRVLSTYKYQINGNGWTLLGQALTGHGSGQWHFQNPAFRDEQGLLEPGVLALTLNRRVDGALHDDFRIEAYGQRRIFLRFILQLDADFVDLFEVKSDSIRTPLRTMRKDNDDGVTLVYERNGFQRALRVRLSSSPCRIVIAGSRVTFALALEHCESWHCCVDAEPELNGRVLKLASDPHQPQQEPASLHAAGLCLESEPLLQEPFMFARRDLHALAIDRGEGRRFVAAGIPWFLALFGRDSLLPAIMAGLDGAWSGEGALAALQAHQARGYDDFRDEQPGKFPHELRDDELTFRGELPYSPYYGTHDVPSLYCLALWNTWRWTGARDLVEKHIDAALHGLEWCDKHGDQDGDGLQEYATRSRKGYRNQGWKDAGDAIVDSAGRQPEVPLATVELQGYLYAARLAMAELLDCLGEAEQAQDLRGKALALRELVERRYWLQQEGFYALALDKDKKPADAIASNAGHLLWCGLSASDRASTVARRLIADDMFSGWGLRTLSSRNPAYNPLSYQRGSVWPFDTMLSAAGLWRYGEHESAFMLVRAILEAAQCFESSRMPELFGGFARSHGVPVPYQEANIPQAWSAAVPIMIVQLLLGLVPDAPNGRCHIEPRLPEWLSRLSVSGIAIGNGTLDIAISRRGEETVVDQVRATGVEVLRGIPRSVLWGKPWADGAGR